MFIHRFLFALIFSLALPAFAQTPAPAATAGAEPSPALRRKQQALAQIYREASELKAGTPERAKLQDEFLARSADFVADQPNAATVWLLRAAICLERDRPREGWEAGRALIRLGWENNSDASVQDVFVKLERKNWLGEKPPASAATALSDGDRLEMGTLVRLTQEAAGQSAPAAISAALAAVLKRSEALAQRAPDHLPIWQLRAHLALELDQPNSGWLASKQIKRLAPSPADSKLSDLLVKLNARGWLGDSSPFEGRAITIADLGLTLAPISAGRFTMGSPANESEREPDEGPQTAVTLRAFWLGKTEVTKAQWQAVMGNNPSNFKGKNLPVEKVSWDEAMEFCRKLTKREREAERLPEGYGYTLPTEAQWEYACRAGTSTAYAGNLDTMAWYATNSGNTAHAVGAKPANAWGLHDMHGNVWEWCLDWYAARLPGGTVSDPTGAASGSRRVRRGGGWVNSAGLCRSAYRFWNEPGYRNNDTGFRLALSSVP